MAGELTGSGLPDTGGSWVFRCAQPASRHSISSVMPYFMVFFLW
nr:hypothetical protein [Salmonella sp.]